MMRSVRSASIMIDPTAKEQALKYIDEAIALTAGDETLGKPFKAFRDKIDSGATRAPGSAPKGSAPKVPADSKKGA